MINLKPAITVVANNAASLTRQTVRYGVVFSAIYVTMNGVEQVMKSTAK